MAVIIVHFFQRCEQIDPTRFQQFDSKRRFFMIWMLLDDQALKRSIECLKTLENWIIARCIGVAYGERPLYNQVLSLSQ